MRATLEVLAKVFMFRSCTGPEPGGAAGRPCLDYYIKRCEAPCVGYVSKEEYRASIDGVIDFLSGRFKAIERDLERRMREAAAAEEFEQATVERNRCARCTRCWSAGAWPTSRSARSTPWPWPSTGGRPTRRSFRCATGCSPTASRSTSPTRPSGSVAEVAEEFMLQYYGGHMSIPALLVVQRELAERSALAEALASRRGGPVELRAAERGEKRRILELAERNARLALDQERLRSERRRQSRVEALEGLQRGARPRRAADPDRVLRHLQPRRHAHGRLDGRVRGRRAEEGRLPALHDPHARRAESDDYAAMAEVLPRRFAQWERQADISPHDPAYDASFASLPNVVVIDGGKGQLAAGLGPLRGFRDRGVAVVSLAKRIEELFIPGRRSPLVLDHSTPPCSCCNACATRRIASRSPTTAPGATGR